MRVGIHCIVGLAAAFATSAVFGETGLDLRTWRVKTENCAFSAESEFAGRSPVYRLVWSDEKGKVELAKGFMRWMLDSWMPPYVASSARQISFSVYHIEGCGRLHLGYDVDGRPVTRHFESSQFKRGAWTDYAFDLGLKPGQALGGVRICCDGGGVGLQFLLADVRVVLDDGRTYEILNPDPPRYMAMMKEPVRRTMLVVE